MSWKNLKIFAIITLLVMDIVFAFFVIERRYSVSYYDDTLIDSAITVFSASDLHVDRSFLEAKKKMPAVYTGKITSTLFSEVTEAMERGGYQIQEDTGGMRFVGETDEFFFGNDFIFTYISAEGIKLPSVLLEEGLWVALSDGEEKTSVFQTAIDFLKSKALISDTFAHYSYDISCRYVYRLGGNYIVHLIQSVDGMALESGLYLLISDGNVTCADGTFSILLPKDKKSAENADLLNILFAEKAYIASLDKNTSDYTVSDISYSYGLYFDSDDTFYLIPLCKITYLNGEERVYNFVSGKLYA
ncbi:MAG: hypothetical protein IJ489_09200 [Clostridia bacterium]|nr:hypothetical protein [Clostridia bacterium]